MTDKKDENGKLFPDAQRLTKVGRFDILPVYVGKILKRNNHIFDILFSGYVFVATKLNLWLSKIANFKEKDTPLHIYESEKYLSIRLASSEYRYIRKDNIRVTYRMYGFYCGVLDSKKI